MKLFKRTACAAFMLAFGSIADAQSTAVIQTINQAAQNAASILNSGSTFITNFKGVNDLAITPLIGGGEYLFTDNFGGANPGNNPLYLQNFVGSSANGTGNGTAGQLTALGMNTYAPNNSLQFDFSLPLVSTDHILFFDIDGPEKYLVQAYSLVSGSYQALSLAGWTEEAFSGQSGQTPTSSWAIWDGAAGSFTSNSGSVNLNEPLNVLTPNQTVNRLVVTKVAGDGWNIGVQAVTSVPEPSSAGLAAAGALAMALGMRRKSSRANP